VSVQCFYQMNMTDIDEQIIAKLKLGVSLSLIARDMDLPRSYVLKVYKKFKYPSKKGDRHYE